MSFEIRGRSYPIQRRFGKDKFAEEMFKKYELLAQSKPNGRLRGSDIDLNDLDILLERYATDPYYDSYAIGDILHISRSALYGLLHSENMGDAFESACNQRAGVMLKRGYEVLEETLELSRKGESNRDMVNASKNLANFSLSYAQMISKDYNMNARDQPGAVSINIKLPEFNQQVIDCGLPEVEVETKDEP